MSIPYLLPRGNDFSYYCKPSNPKKLPKSDSCHALFALYTRNPFLTILNGIPLVLHTRWKTNPKAMTMTGASASAHPRGMAQAAEEGRLIPKCSRGSSTHSRDTRYRHQESEACRGGKPTTTMTVATTRTTATAATAKATGTMMTQQQRQQCHIYLQEERRQQQ